MLASFARWQLLDQVCCELEDEDSVQRVKKAIAVDVGSLAAGQSTYEAGIELQDERRVYRVYRAIAVGVA